MNLLTFYAKKPVIRYEVTAGLYSMVVYTTVVKLDLQCKFPEKTVHTVDLFIISMNKTTGCLELTVF